MVAGRVYLVGVGPGDPGLITVKGKQVIETADVVVYDRHINPEFLKWVTADCEVIKAGVRKTPESLSQGEVVQLMIERAEAGKKVARLKEGDPFLFGRGAEEMLALQTVGVEFEVVCGVTSALAVPAYAGIPLSYRSISSAVGLFILSEESLSSIQWGKLACCLQTLVFLRGVDILPKIVRNLLSNGWPDSTPVALLQWGTLPQQVVVSGVLIDIVNRAADLDEKAPSIIVVGEVVQFRERLAWFEKKPLTGLRIMVTRSTHQAADLSSRLSLAGARPINIPTIKIKPLENPTILRSALTDLESFDWLIFSSVNAAQYFKENLYNAGKDVRDLKGIKIIAVGSASAKAVREWGLKVDLVPAEFSAEGIIKELKKIDISGQRFLLPRAKKAREILPETIQEMGGSVVIAPIYETVAEEESAQILKDTLSNGEVDLITFTSSSTLRHFYQMINQDSQMLHDVKIAVIGPVTEKTATQMGLNVDIMPTVSTIDGLVEAIEDYYREK